MLFEDGSHDSHAHFTNDDAYGFAVGQEFLPARCVFHFLYRHVEFVPVLQHHSYDFCCYFSLHDFLTAGVEASRYGRGHLLFEILDNTIFFLALIPLARDRDVP